MKNYRTAKGGDDVLSPPGYVAAMSDGQPWQSENSFLNAVLVSVQRREKKLLDSLVKAGVSFSIQTEPSPSRKIIIISNGEVAGFVTYRGSSVPRDIATRVVVALATLAGKSMESVVSVKNRKPVVPRNTVSVEQPATKNVPGSDEAPRALPQETLVSLEDYVPPKGSTPLRLGTKLS